jgi:hypothetical protein
MVLQRKVKAHSLTGRITSGLLRDSFKAVKRNRGAAGIDKVSIQMFEANLEENLQALLQELKQGTFQPHPLRRVFIPKNETEFRPLGIPAVKDRVARRSFAVCPLEPLFHDASYGFRPGRNYKLGRGSVPRQGSSSFSMPTSRGSLTTSHRVIMRQSLKADGNILRLVERLTSGVMENGVRMPTHRHAPWGCFLLANIVLNHWDWQLESRPAVCLPTISSFSAHPASGGRGAGSGHAGSENGLGLQLSREKTYDSLERLRLSGLPPFPPFPAHAP